MGSVDLLLKIQLSNISLYVNLTNGFCNFGQFLTKKYKMRHDTTIFDLINEEQDRQIHGIELIASENFVSDQVMEAAAIQEDAITVDAKSWMLLSK